VGFQGQEGLMAVDSSGLVRAAMMLRGEAPAAWTGFVGALQEYAAAMNGEMLKCAPELLHRGQGVCLMRPEPAPRHCRCATALRQDDKPPGKTRWPTNRTSNLHLASTSRSCPS